MPIRFKALPPEQALKFFRQKGFVIGFDHRDVWQAEQQAAFTVAKAMQLDLLQDIRAQVDSALANGTTLQQFSKALKPNLVARGWWGRATMTDPLTGEDKDVQLGSTRRLKTIYDTNLRTAHAEGQWARIQESKASFPYLMYDGNNSEHPRLQHAAWDGLVIPADDPWWQSHMPVKAWGCKCRVIQMGQRQIDRQGLKVSDAPAESYRDYINKRTGETQRIPGGVDPAFHYPPGGRLENLGRMLAGKVEQAPVKVGAAVFRQAAQAVMPALMQDYTGWVNAIDGGGSKGLGARRVIGAYSEKVVSGLAELGVVLSSAAVSVEQREVAHLFAEERKGRKSVARAFVYALPEKLLAPAAVIYDATPGSEAILYVFKRPGGKYYRVAVRPNFKLKGENYTNSVRSGHIVERDNLSGKYFTVLEGEL
ncbi:MAG: phage minor head protein [Burkholderiales bacterium]|nr:phage minor head protein [Burkholderiales bacterium]